MRVLIIEDHLPDFKLMKLFISESLKSSVLIDNAGSLTEGLLKIGKNKYDVVLSDLNVLDSNGIETFKILLNNVPDIPIIVLSGIDDEQIAIDAIKLGAQDYLVKGNINAHIINRSISYSIERKKSYHKLCQLNKKINLQASKLNKILSTLPEQIIMIDDSDNVVYLNESFAKFHKVDYDSDLPIPLSSIKLDAEFILKLESIISQVRKTELSQMGIIELNAYGNKQYLECFIHKVSNIAGEIQSILVSFKDLTDQYIMQGALIESEDNYRLLVENAPFGICRFYISGELSYINDSFAKSLGYLDKFELIKYQKSIAPSNKTKWEKLIENNSSFGEMVDLMVEFRKKDGSDIELLMSISRSGNQLTGMVIDLERKKHIIS